MTNLLLVAEQVMILFVLVGFGALFRRLRLMSDEGYKTLAEILIRFVTPCLIVDCFQRPFDPSMLKGLGLAFALALGGHLAAIAGAYAVIRVRDESTRRPLLLAAVFSNAGFMGIPLEQALLGDDGVFYGIAYVVVFNLMIWSWGVCAMAQEKGYVSGWRMFVNPGTVGLALGLPLFFFSVKLPACIGMPIHHMANLNTPLAMIVIGYCLGGMKNPRVLCQVGLWVAALFRLVVYPLAMIGALYCLRGWLDRNMMLALTIAASAPTAAMVAMFAMTFHRDVDTSVTLVTGTTLLSILTMPPLIALAMQVLGGG